MIPENTAAGIHRKHTVLYRTELHSSANSDQQHHCTWTI